MKHQMTDTKFTCAKTACSNPVPFGGLLKEIEYRKEFIRIINRYGNRTPELKKTLEREIKQLKANL